MEDGRWRGDDTEKEEFTNLVRQDLMAAPDLLLELIHGQPRGARKPESE